jgi:hypothetical protein
VTVKQQIRMGVMTNVSEKDQLMSLLFGGDTTLLDLKVFRGFAPKGVEVTTEDICREIHSAVTQKENGTATVSKSFGDDAPKVDVRTLFRA